MWDEVAPSLHDSWGVTFSPQIHVSTQVLVSLVVQHLQVFYCSLWDLPCYPIPYDL